LRRVTASFVSVGLMAILIATGVLAVAAPTARDSAPAAAHWNPSPSDWPAFRNDLGRTGVSPATATMKMAYYKWAYRTGGSRISSSPAVANVDISDRNPEILIGSEDYRLYCLNATSGRMKWRFQTQGAVSSSPAVGDLNGDGLPEVVFGSGDGRVYALAGANGSRLWSYTTRSAVLASPAIADINGDGSLEVVAASMDGMLYALRGDGSMIWRESVVVINDKNGEGIYASPAIADIYDDGWMKIVVCAGNNLDIFNGTDGNEETMINSGTLESHYLSTPAVKDLDGNGRSEVITISGDPPQISVHSVNSSGSIGTWRTGPDWIRVVSSPAICDGDVDGFQEAYFGTDSGRIVAVHFRPGGSPFGGGVYIDEEWSRNITGPVRSSPAMADLDGDGKMELVVGSDNRRVVALNAEDGTPCWMYLVPKAVFSSPAVADGDLDGKAEVFFGCYDGAVYALDYNF